MDRSEHEIEMGVGDLLHRRRMTSDILRQGVEYRMDKNDYWMFGPLRVKHHPGDDLLAVHDPDGELHEVSINADDPMTEQIETVESRLRHVWKEWLEEL